jgi:hypothetical protein
MTMQVFSYQMIGADELQYSVRLLLTPEELRGLQKAMIVPLNVAEVLGMQDVADGLVATMEREMLLLSGGVMQ